MDFEWDEAKDAANRAKHGIGLGEAGRMDWSAGVVIGDKRRDYGEPGYTRFAPIDGRLQTCAFTLRSDAIRIISLRRSNKREIRKHGQELSDTNH